MMIFESALISILVAAAAVPQTPVTIIQKTTGWCSPVIANVIGNVTVNCIGVDPRALKRLNDELNRKNLELADKIREADEWTNRYKELETRLSEAGDDTGLSRQAEEYLHEGELEKAGTILDQILGKEEKQIDQTAANHYNRALVDLGAGDVDDQSCDLHDSSMHRLPPTRLSVNPKMGTEAGLGESWECGLPDSRARRLSVALRPSRSSGPVRGARFV